MFQHFQKNKIWFIVIMLLVAGSAVFYLYAMGRERSRMSNLYKPKTLMMRVDEIAFPKNGRRPVQAMKGSPTTISCETVGPTEKQGSAVFRFKVNGKITETTTCSIKANIDGEIGSIQTVSMEYLLKQSDGSLKSVDKYDAQIKLVAGGHFLRIKNFGNLDGKAYETLTVPRLVIPYVNMAVKLDEKPEKYVVLFFVNELGSNLPILQVTQQKQAGQKFDVIQAALERFRAYGTELDGYAAWTKEPIQLGTESDARKVYEVHAGLFEKEKVNNLADQLIRYDGKDENGDIKAIVVPKSLEDIKKLAWRGWVSESIRVVRSE